MKKILKIPEYALEIHIEGTKVQCIDQTSQQIIYSEILKRTINKVEKERYDKFYLIHSEEYQYTLIVKPKPKIKSVISTKSSYILDLHLKNPDHGFFFGLYQIGEFILKYGAKIILRRTFPIKYCNKGLISPSNEIYLSLRESETLDGPHSYFLAKIDWNTEPKPSLVWKKPVTKAILSIHLVNNLLFLGMKDGSLQQWNIKNDMLLNTINLFNSPVSVLEKGINKIIATTWNGNIAALTEDGTTLWKSKPSNKQISGVFENKKGIHVVNYQGIYYLLDSTTGETLTQQDWNISTFPDKSTLSNMIETNNWIIISSGGNFAGYWKKDYSKTFQLYRVNQPLVQRLATHPRGFYTGDDEGRLIFWELSPITIKEGKIE